MGACMIACKKDPSLDHTHETVEIRPVERAQIEQAVKADPPHLPEPPQTHKPNLEIEQQEEPSRESLPEQPKQVPRLMSRTSIKSRFFMERNFSQVATDAEDPPGPPQVILRRATRKGSRMPRKHQFRENDWEDESTQRSSTPRKKHQISIQDQAQNDANSLPQHSIRLRDKKPLLLPQQEAQIINANANEVPVSSESLDDSLTPKTKVQYQDGSHYQGEVVRGMRHGTGTLNWKDGCRYEGEWSQGLPNGVGVLIYADGDQYSGEFTNSQPCGKGEFFSPEGLTYNGEWKEGQAEGQGTEVFGKGEKYVGGWSKGKKSGYGELFFEDGASFYKGHFVNNELQGQGEYYWHGKSHYVGTWLHNEKSGRGRLELANGESFQGEFLRDKMHGRGTFLAKNGSRFEGMWENGRREGLIVETTSTGEVRRGVWYFNQFLRHLGPNEAHGEQKAACAASTDSCL